MVFIPIVGIPCDLEPHMWLLPLNFCKSHYCKSDCNYSLRLGVAVTSAMIHGHESHDSSRIKKTIHMLCTSLIVSCKPFEYIPVTHHWSSRFLQESCILQYNEAVIWGSKKIIFQCLLYRRASISHRSHVKGLLHLATWPTSFDLDNVDQLCSSVEEVL